MAITLRKLGQILTEGKAVRDPLSVEARAAIVGAFSVGVSRNELASAFNTTSPTITSVLKRFEEQTSAPRLRKPGPFVQNGFQKRYGRLSTDEQARIIQMTRRNSRGHLNRKELLEAFGHKVCWITIRRVVAQHENTEHDGVFPIAKFKDEDIQRMLQIAKRNDKGWLNRAELMEHFGDRASWATIRRWINRAQTDADYPIRLKKERN